MTADIIVGFCVKGQIHTLLYKGFLLVITRDICQFLASCSLPFSIYKRNS